MTGIIPAETTETEDGVGEEACLPMTYFVLISIFLVVWWHLIL